MFKFSSLVSLVLSLLLACVASGCAGWLNGEGPVYSNYNLQYSDNPPVVYNLSGGAQVIVTTNASGDVISVAGVDPYQDEGESSCPPDQDYGGDSSASSGGDHHYYVGGGHSSAASDDGGDDEGTAHGGGKVAPAPPPSPARIVRAPPPEDPPPAPAPPPKKAGAKKSRK